LGAEKEMKLTIKLFNADGREAASSEQEYIYGKTNYFFPTATSNWGTITYAAIMFEGQVLQTVVNATNVSPGDMISLQHFNLDEFAIDLAIRAVNARAAKARDEAATAETLRQMKLDHLKERIGCCTQKKTLEWECSMGVSAAITTLMERSANVPKGIKAIV
jgi:hypothetical protein